MAFLLLTVLLAAVSLSSGTPQANSYLQALFDVPQSYYDSPQRNVAYFPFITDSEHELDPRQEPTCDPIVDRLKCYNETAISLCTLTGEEVIPCPAITPRCSPILNVCVGGRVDPPGSPDFDCPVQDGYYPDPNTCKKYYFCVNGTPKEYGCDWTDVYDPKTRSCVHHLPPNLCYRFHCFGKQGRYTPYPGEPAVFTLCSNNQPTEIFRCDPGQAMSEKEQKCTTHCEKEGLMKDAFSCQTYYECTRTLVGYRVRKGECPDLSWFDPEINQCTPITDPAQCPGAVPSEPNLQAFKPSEKPNEQMSAADQTTAVNTE